MKCLPRTERKEGNSAKQTFRTKKFLRCERAWSVHRQGHMQLQEEGAKDVKSGELGAVARLWEWPCVTSKGEGDIPWAIVLQIFWSDEDRLELCSALEGLRDKSESQASLFIFELLDLCRICILPQSECVIWHDFKLPFCKYCYSLLPYLGLSVSTLWGITLSKESRTLESALRVQTWNPLMWASPFHTHRGALAALEFCTHRVLGTNPLKPHCTCWGTAVCCSSLEGGWAEQVGRKDSICLELMGSL